MKLFKNIALSEGAGRALGLHDLAENDYHEYAQEEEQYDDHLFSFSHSLNLKTISTPTFKYLLLVF